MRTKIERIMRSAAGAALGCALVTSAGLALVGASTANAGAVVTAADDAVDELVLQNGRVVKGRIVEETDREIRFVVIYAGFEAETTFPRADVLSIRRGADRPAAADDAGGDAPAVEAPRRRRGDDRGIEALSGERAPSVFHIRIAGELNQDIAVQPVRDALEAAGRADTDRFGEPKVPDYLILEIDRQWSDQLGNDLGDDRANFDEFSLTQGIIDVITKEMPQRWNGDPHIVAWVKTAMGGAAFIPFVGETIVFHPEGRMGGIGNLREIFDGVGDDVVGQKQRSLRLAAAQGLAIEGGYDYRIVTAMARRDYELSYRFNGGVTELLERTPENPGEFLLTENGRVRENIDSIRQRVDGTGDDVLTLREDTARHLGVSAGTAETLDDVLDILGIYRDHRMLENNTDRIFDGWSRSLRRAERELPKMWRDYNDVAAGGTYRERRRAIGRRINILEEMQQTLARFNGESEFPVLRPNALGIPDPVTMNQMIERHRVELILAQP